MPNSNTKMGARALLAGGGAVIALLAGLPATAQTADEISELVVTARKVEENLKDVPVAVTSMSASAMEDRLIQDLRDVSLFTPGFQLNEAFGRTADRPVIRGASNIISSEGKVGVFVDGIPFFGAFSALDLDQAARVEVIRGPQSAVFGRGTLSGAINIVTRTPGSDFAGRMKATIGSYGRHELSGAASGPLLVDWLSGDISFKAYEIQGMFDNLALAGGDIGAQKSFQVMAGLRATPTADIEVRARYLYTKDDDGISPLSLQPAAFNNCFLTTRPYYCGVVRTPGPFFANADRVQSPGVSREGHRGYLDVNWDVMGSGYALNYQGGVTEIRQVFGTDQTYDNRDFFLFNGACAFIPIGNQTCARSPFNTTDASFRTAFTHEVRLSSPANQPVRWRVGAYQGLDRAKPLAEFLESTEAGLDTLGDATRTRNTAVFGGIDWDILPTLTLGLEVRRQKDEVRSQTLSYTASQYFAPSAIATLLRPNPNQVVGVAGVRQTEFEATLPRATLTWRWTPETTLYAQYAEGNSPGGFNPIDAPQSTFDEEKLKSREVGVKTTLFGFDYLGLSAFDQTFEGQVLTNTYQSATAISIFRANIGETSIRGLELEGQRGMFLPGVKLQFTYTYLDAEITEGVEPEQALLLLGVACKQGTTSSTNLALPGCRAAASIVGKRPPLVSKHMGTVGLRYEGEPIWGDFSLFGGVDVIYRSSFFDQVMNLAKTGDATRVNFQLGVQDDNGLRLTFWGKNVFDNDTPEGILRYVDLAIGSPRSPSRDSSRAFAITPARPIEYGVTFAKAF